MTIAVRVSRTTAHHLELGSRSLGKAARRFRAAVTARTVRVPFSRRARKRLRHVRKLALEVTVTASVAAGRPTRVERFAVRLRR